MAPSTARFLFLGLAGTFVACGGSSDGGEGDLGKVRFSLVSNYSDNSDLSAPVATGRPIFVALQRPKDGFLDDETFVNLTLQVQRSDGSEVESVWPMGFAQYGVMLEEAGAYRLVAMDGGQRIDRIEIKADDLTGIDLSRRVFVTTSYESAGRSCTKLEEVQGIENVTLHQNQRIEVAVLPKNGGSQNLLGLLALTARGPSSVMLDAQILGQGRLANSFIIKPDGPLPSQIDLTITEEEAGLSIPVSVKAKDVDFVLDCTQ
jgi:hypothetical protein